MRLQRTLDAIGVLATRQVVPQGILDEGRIFSLGKYVNEDHLHGRVRDVVEGLKDHVGQPFDLHPWAFTIDVCTFKQTGHTSPMTVIGIVFPQADGSVAVSDYIFGGRGARKFRSTLFRHTAAGTNVSLLGGTGLSKEQIEDKLGGAFYPLAIAVLNTRGCSIDLKRAPKLANEKRVRKGKLPVPAHYDVDAKEYFTALGSASSSKGAGGSHASPIPHLRRAHERVLSDGKRLWIPSALVNVRSEGDLAFVERRKSYRRNDRSRNS